MHRYQPSSLYQITIKRIISDVRTTHTRDVDSDKEYPHDCTACGQWSVHNDHMYQHYSQLPVTILHDIWSTAVSGDDMCTAADGYPLFLCYFCLFFGPGTKQLDLTLFMESDYYNDLSTDGHGRIAALMKAVMKERNVKLEVLSFGEFLQDSCIATALITAQPTLKRLELAGYGNDDIIDLASRSLTELKVEFKVWADCDKTCLQLIPRDSSQQGFPMLESLEIFGITSTDVLSEILVKLHHLRNIRCFGVLDALNVVCSNGNKRDNLCAIHLTTSEVELLTPETVQMYQCHGYVVGSLELFGLYPDINTYTFLNSVSHMLHLKQLTLCAAYVPVGFTTKMLEICGTRLGSLDLEVSRENTVDLSIITSNCKNLHTLKIDGDEESTPNQASEHNYIERTSNLNPLENLKKLKLHNLSYKLKNSNEIMSILACPKLEHIEIECSSVVSKYVMVKVIRYRKLTDPDHLAFPSLHTLRIVDQPAHVVQLFMENARIINLCKSW